MPADGGTRRRWARPERRLPPDIGISTDPFAPVPLGEALARAAGIAHLVEIGSHGRHSLLTAANRRAARESGLRLTVHGPYWGLDLGSPDERLRRKAVTVHRHHFLAAADVGARCYVVHPDYAPEPREDDGRVVAALKCSIAELQRLQDGYATRIVLENMPDRRRSHFLTPHDVDLGPLGFCLDAGHAAIAGVLDGCLADTSPHLSHVHLHDNRGAGDVADPHLPLGAGVLDIEAVLAATRGGDVTIILEMLDEAAISRSVAHLGRLGLLATAGARPAATLTPRVIGCDR